MDIYVLTPNDEGGWSLKREDAERSSRNFESKEEALDFAREFMSSREATLKIFKKDGSIQEERTYPKASDPERTPG
jgi:hypothetical protein